MIRRWSRWHIGPNGTDTYAYDPAGRLTVVWDQHNGQPCIQRGYTLDADSNRTELQTWPANPQGTCPPATTPATTASYSYDTADRLQPTGTATGITYDAFGRITTLPAALAGGSTTSIGYHTTDMAATQTQGGTTRTWTLDPAGRLRTAALTGTPTKTNHYDDTSDSPAWIDEGDNTRTRYLTGLDGNLAAAITINGTTDVTYQLSGLHGDIVTTTSPSAPTPDGAFVDYDEYGNPRSSTPTARYGWLGAKQRSADSFAGLILMGVRLYHPTLGRFLQTDPIEGGSANNYDYARQDPVNMTDLSGECPCDRYNKHRDRHQEMGQYEVAQIPRMEMAHEVAYCPRSKQIPIRQKAHTRLPRHTQPLGGHPSRMELEQPARQERILRARRLREEDQMVAQACSTVALRLPPRHPMQQRMTGHGLR